MARSADRLFVYWLLAVLGFIPTAARAHQQEAAQAPAAMPSTSTSTPLQGALRTFTIEKPATIVEQERQTETALRVPLNLPKAHESLHTTVGLGYVQGADWGGEILAIGSAAGIQVQLSTLLTKGSTGFLLDRGSLSLFDPERRWRVEAGDIFSNLRGASRGARVSWPAAGGRRPAIAVYGPRPGTPHRQTVVSYRDQIQIGAQTLLDAEVASDKSYLVRSRLVVSRVDLEASYRSHRKPVSARDASLSGGIRVWHGVTLTGSLLRSTQGGERSDWRMVAVRVPFSRSFDVTLQRAYAATDETANTTSAAMANVAAGRLRLFHRYQVGEFDYARAGFSSSIERQQTQSMASYMSGSWLNLTLQLATQRTDTGQTQHWEELQTTVRLTRSTTVRAVTAVPDMRNAKRFRAHFRQDLPFQFAVQADYGRLSAFQAIPNELDRSRLKVMLYRTWNVATPARGAEVRGRVIDEAGRAVSGARVKLGSYTVDTDPTGFYVFRHVPRGVYDLALDGQFLPAGYAWDGRALGLSLTSSTKMLTDLLVAPLNAIHGRVYCDRNANGRYDAGEAVASAVVHLDDRVTATDQNGAYSFYNLVPGSHVLRLNREKLPAEFEATGPVDLPVELGDFQPVTEADFRVAVKTKPIIWRGPGK
jgi:hypothetical protein